MERNISIDIGKGFAIVCVVMSHVLQKSIYGDDVIFEVSAVENFFVLVQMPLFMLLSGLVVKRVERKNVFRGLCRRIRILLVPFFVFGSLYVIIVLGNYKSPYNFLFTDFKAGYWYFQILFYCYLINYFLNVLFPQTGRPILIVKLLASLFLWKALMFLGNHFLHESLISMFCLKPHLFGIIPFFFVGSFVNEMGWIKYIEGNVYFILGCLIVLLIGNTPLYRLSVVLLIFGLVCHFKETVVGPLLACLGKNSIYIYCFHFFFFKQMNLTFLSEWCVGNSSVFSDLLLASIPTVIIITISLFLKMVVKSNQRIHGIIFGR